MAAHLAKRDIGWEALETSLRWLEGEAPSGRRMMIERLDAEDARALLSPVCKLPALADALLETARRERLFVIAGWDMAGEPTWKLYLNASDASARLRERLRRQLLPSTMRGGPDAPHVIGLNLTQAHTEVKLYEQGSTLFPDAPQAFRSWAASTAVSGFVRSFRLAEGEEARPKAWFAGLPTSPRPELSFWPDFDDARARVSPFEMGRITSVGISSAQERWTVYFKPKGHSVPQWSLDPFACFSNGHCEVGVYLEPTTIAERAYAKTARWAISYRMRDGRADGEAIDRLMSWFVAQVAESESPPAKLNAPPEPWHVVD